MSNYLVVKKPGDMGGVLDNLKDFAGSLFSFGKSAVTSYVGGGQQPVQPTTDYTPWIIGGVALITVLLLTKKK